jgi:hypothetical protein
MAGQPASSQISKSVKKSYAHPNLPQPGASLMRPVSRPRARTVPL